MVTSRSTRALTSSALHTIQKLDIGPTFFGRFLGELIQALWHPRELQAFQDSLQVFIAVIIHQDTSQSS